MKIIINGLREIFALIDSAIYGLIERAFQLILDLANVEIFSETAINNFARRLYIILGLVMVFKLMISFIQIIVNPDKMDDKEQGIGNVLKRVIISLALIVLVPSIFDLARQVQEYILPIIPRVILGANINPDINDPDTQEKMAETGRMMAFYSFLPFFGYDNLSCDDGSIIGTGTSQVDGSNVTIYSVETARDHIIDTDACSTDKHGYKYNYRILMSTIVGAYILFVLIQIAVEVAVRAIKFGICELLAPIPIASYIDPKSSKQTFDNWVNTSLKTYADLFIRIVLLYFIIFIFMTVFDDATLATMTSKLGGDGLRKTFVILFIIIGLLQFVKQAPKFLESLLGLKGGDGSLMGMFKGEGYKAIKEASAIPGTIAAAAGSAIGNARYAWKNGESGISLIRGISGAASALRRGATATLRGEGWKGAYTDNIRTTTGISQARVNARIMAARSAEEYDRAIAEIDNDSSLSADEKRAAKARVPKPIQPIRENIQNAINRWQGMESPTGSSYSSAASTLASWREKYYTGEAMKKLDEGAGNALHAAGIEHGTKSTIYNKDGTVASWMGTYNQARELFDQLNNGSYTGPLSSSAIRTIFSEAQKNAAADYITAETTGIKDSNGNMILKLNDNTTINEMDKQVMGMLEGLGIESNLRKQLIADYRNDPGKFFKSLSDISKQLETSGARRSSYEQNQDKSNNS